MIKKITAASLMAILLSTSSTFASQRVNQEENNVVSWGQTWNNTKTAIWNKGGESASNAWSSSRNQTSIVWSKTKAWAYAPEQYPFVRFLADRIAYNKIYIFAAVSTLVSLKWFLFSPEGRPLQDIPTQKAQSKLRAAQKAPKDAQDKNGDRKGKMRKSNNNLPIGSLGDRKEQIALFRSMQPNELQTLADSTQANLRMQPRDLEVSATFAQETLDKLSDSSHFQEVLQEIKQLRMSPTSSLLLHYLINIIRILSESDEVKIDKITTIRESLDTLLTRVFSLGFTTQDEVNMLSRFMTMLDSACESRAHRDNTSLVAEDALGDLRAILKPIAAQLAHIQVTDLDELGSEVTE